MDSQGTVLIFDASTYSLKKTISVGKEPAEITFSPDGMTAFAANGGSAMITAIKVSEKSVIGTINVGSNPVGAWPGSNGMMYVDNEKGKTVSVINISTMKVKKR